MIVIGGWVGRELTVESKSLVAECYRSNAGDGMYAVGGRWLWVQPRWASFGGLGVRGAWLGLVQRMLSSWLLDGL